ncbi:MAG: ATP-binding protein [Candidatus Aminicenantes bacterium]|nr:ATP-binding protein [Candidatus Aminicenantes bacterium]
MDILSISDTRCRKCYRCVRECPTNALKIDQGTVKRIWNRCILCGICYRYCPHDAVSAHTGVKHVRQLLDSGQKVVVCLDPTFPAVLDRGTPGQLVTALKKLGFSEVWESAVGGDLVAGAYRSWLARNTETSWISSFCPSLVYYIEKFAPHLADRLVPIVSPMIACGLAVKHLNGAKTKVVFVGSCISRIWERMDRFGKQAIDYVLIYHDITNLLEARGIDREAQEPSEFDGPASSLGRTLSVSGGMSRCAGFDQDLLSLDHVVESGAEEVIRAVRQLQEGKIRSQFLDLLFCQGCINGPVTDKKISGPSRKQIVVDYIKAQDKARPAEARDDLEALDHLDFSRRFAARDVSVPDPADAEIEAILAQLGKAYPNQNLDCGACGYSSCWEKAKAVVQGLAKTEMCYHYLLESLQGLYSRLEKSHEQLKSSHEELEKAQRQLIQTEKMASLGQLAAGVAHELNNPIGTIMMFSRILQREMNQNDKWQKDINLVVQEADRAAKIVKDLLSFAKETKIRPGLVSINRVIEDALSLLVKQSLFHNIEVVTVLDSSLPTTFADPDLLKQVFFNIILNGAQAMDGKGVLTVRSLKVDDGRKIEIRIEDTGKGIPEKHLPRLFDPFFTTKEKGTGLGLALVYSIVSKHKGAVFVESQLGQGATFIILLPVLGQDEWNKSEGPVEELKDVPEGKSYESQRKDLIG